MPPTEEPKYHEKVVRISVDVPKSLKESLSSNIPHGLLSTVTRVLYTELIKLFEKHGIKETISAMLNNRISISILERDHHDT